MKKLILSLIVALSLFQVKTVSAADGNWLQNALITNLQQTIALDVQANNLINWQVGDSQDYDVSAVFGNLGTMHKWVDHEEGNAIWVHEKLSGMMGDHLSQVLIDRADGKILKMIQDGKDQQIPDEKLEIIKQEATKITVPAGTFDAIHIVAKAPDIKNLEVWVNPRDVSMDGSIQILVDSGQLPITLKLTKFTKK